MNITKNTIRTLRGRIDRALADVAAEYGITLTTGNARYTDYDFTLQLKGAVIDAGDGITADEKRFHEYSAHYGLEPDDFGREFVANGRTFKISGIKPKNRKYPIIATSDGVSYKFAARSVRMYLVGVGS